MKNLVKILFAAMVLVAVSSGAYAQVASSADNNVTASVLTGLTVTQSTAISFGIVEIGKVPNLNPVTGEKTNINNATSATIGKFLVTGTASGSIKVFWNDQITMANTESTPKNLYFNPAVSQVDDEAASAFGGASYTKNDNLNLPASGKKTFWIGGTLTAQNGTSVIPEGSNGTYTGTFVLTAQYN